MSAAGWRDICLFQMCGTWQRGSVALARILVDGYSMLFGCPEIAPGKLRYSAAARDELAAWLTHYQDACNVPITVIFDGGQGSVPTADPVSKPEMEILYANQGRTADDLIERAAHRLLAFGEVLVVTDDLAERETVQAFGGSAVSCRNFWRQVEMTQEDFKADLARFNTRERRAYRNSGR